MCAMRAATMAGERRGTSRNQPEPAGTGRNRARPSDGGRPWRRPVSAGAVSGRWSPSGLAGRQAGRQADEEGRQGY